MKKRVSYGNRLKKSFIRSKCSVREYGFITWFGSLFLGHQFINYRGMSDNTPKYKVPNAPF